MELRPAGRVRLSLLVLWFALLAGLSELALLGFRHFVLHEHFQRNRQITWLTPFSYLTFLGLAGLGLFVVSRLVPRLREPRVQVFALGFLASFGVFFLFYPSVHKLAILLLALGIAVQLARATKSPKFARVVSRSIVPMLAVVLLLTIGVNVADMRQRRHELSALGSPPPNAPNIILIVLDTVRSLDVSAQGYHLRTTPALERVAASGVRFDRAIATAPWTLPSHSSMFTGVYPQFLSSNWEDALDATYPTLAEVLVRQGYETGGFSANRVYVSYEHGLDRGFGTWRDYRASLAELVLYSSLGRFVGNSGLVRKVARYYDVLGRKSAVEVNQEALSWLSRDRTRPFFAFLNYFDAHLPYLPPAPYDTMFGPRRPPPPHLYWLNGADRVDKWNMTEAEIAASRVAYDGAIAALDNRVGALLEELKRRGALDNTIVIVTADHGEHFGEHGLLDHGNSLYAPLLHVPLIISWTGHVPAGAAVPQTVSLRDLPATILDVAGLQGALPGHSLAGLWRADAAVTTSAAFATVEPAPRNLNPRYPASRGKMYSLIEGSMHYILNGDGSEELYDLATDAAETNNLVSTARGTGLLPGLRAGLQRARTGR